MHLLTASADAEFASSLNAYLGRFGFTVHACVGSAALPAQLAAQPIDLVLLDLAPRAADALAPARALRQHGSVPFIILGGSATSNDRVAGLDSGAADYLARPFEPRELVARIRSVLRRTGGVGKPSPPLADLTLHFDGWVLQTLTRRLTSPSGEPVALSSAEFRLLHTFLRLPQRALSREQLMAHSRGADAGPVECSLDGLVSRLRHKLAGADDAAPLISTVRGLGYRFDGRPTRPAA